MLPLKSNFMPNRQLLKQIPLEILPEIVLDVIWIPSNKYLLLHNRYDVIEFMYHAKNKYQYINWYLSAKK